MEFLRKRHDVIVIGAGVSGLSCGIRLLEAGFSVRVIARDFPPHTTSDVPAAVWYPFHAGPRERVGKWSEITYHEMMRLAADDPDSGVIVRPMLEVFRSRRDEPWWRTIVADFRRAEKHELPEGYADGFVLNVPVPDTSRYMPYLLDRFRALRGQSEHGQASSLDDLRSNDRIIINCTGLGAREVAGDRSMYPLRGRLVRIHRPPGLNRCIADDEDPVHITYVFPRHDDCILGSTVEKDEWDELIDESISGQIIERCARLEPAVRSAEIIEHRVGLRPGRDEVRLELRPVSDRCAVIHNYGHGGAGFTLSWGCAEEVTRLALSFARRLKPQAKWAR